MKKIIIFSFLYFLFTAAAFAQDFAISISYLRGEKSKDSHSSEESIAISNRNVAYSIEYKGHKGPNQKDDSKTCEFTKKNIQDLRDLIIEKGLNKNDSLFDESTKYKSFERFTNISIAMTVDNSDYKIKINGDTDEIGGRDLYKNALKLINKIRQMVKDC